jgi:hypothetical protein
MSFGHVFQLKGIFPALAVSSLVVMASAFMILNTVMAMQTARISQMNSTVVRYLLIRVFHVVDDKM